MRADEVRNRFTAALAEAIALVALVSLASPAQAAPQTFNSALPIARGELLWREQFLYRKLGGDRSAAHRRLTVRGAISVLGYGANADLALFAVLPVLDQELDVTPPGLTRLSRSATGIGDARLFARYTAFMRNFPGGSLRIAPFAGLEQPTGDEVFVADSRNGRIEVFALDVAADGSVYVADFLNNRIEIWRQRDEWRVPKQSLSSQPALPERQAKEVRDADRRGGARGRRRGRDRTFL